jgi:predicted  nucleic acid-binding Zn-ribbon protein
MVADVDSLRARASQLEDQVLELMELREPYDARLADVSAQLAELTARRQSVRSALTRAEAEVDEELGRMTAQRAEWVAAMSADLLATYERLRARLNGVAVARLHGGRCDGCHLTLPAMELDRIRHLPGDELIFCEQCGRILVRG